LFKCGLKMNIEKERKLIEFRMDEAIQEEQ
jgi:hypothetical protein